ncbi:MAG TPA: DUF4178 domain-containing protein [Vicinamibacterales bacterium]|jgi:hypothetical protein
MTARSATCPDCGAPITFRWSSSVQTVCDYCKSILVRTDVDLKKVGRVADLPPDSSPIQIGTEGVFDTDAFVVIGRIIYEYELGTWNEWHVMTNRGASKWLSDAQNEFVVSALARGHHVPDASELQLGRLFRWENVDYTVTTITDANYKGVQGELPFEYWDATVARFVDLRSHTGEFATVDCSDDRPVLYLGKLADYDDLHLKNVRVFEGWS